MVLFLGGGGGVERIFIFAQINLIDKEMEDISMERKNFSTLKRLGTYPSSYDTSPGLSLVVIFSNNVFLSDLKVI